MAGVTASWRAPCHGRTGQETKGDRRGDSRLAAKGTRGATFATGWWLIPRGASWVALVTRRIRLLPSPARRGEPPVARQRAAPHIRPCTRGITVSLVAAVALPSAVVKLTFPVTARSGTVNVTSVGDEATTTVTTAHLHDRVGAPGLQIRSTHDHRAVQRRDRRCEAGAIECYADRSGQPLEACRWAIAPDARMSTMRRSNASRGVSADPYARAGEDER